MQEVNDYYHYYTNFLLRDSFGCMCFYGYSVQVTTLGYYISSVQKSQNKIELLKLEGGECLA